MLWSCSRKELFYFLLLFYFFFYSGNLFCSGKELFPFFSSPFSHPPTKSRHPRASFIGRHTLMKRNRAPSTRRG